MRIKYDSEADVLLLILRDAPPLYVGGELHIIGNSLRIGVEIGI